jgi:hypothetical protein
LDGEFHDQFSKNKKDQRQNIAMVLQFIPTAGKSLSVLTTVDPKKAGQLLPIGVLKVYVIYLQKSIMLSAHFKK